MWWSLRPVPSQVSAVMIRRQYCVTKNPGKESVYWALLSPLGPYVLLSLLSSLPSSIDRFHPFLSWYCVPVILYYSLSPPPPQFQGNTIKLLWWVVTKMTVWFTHALTCPSQLLSPTDGQVGSSLNPSRYPRKSARVNWLPRRRVRSPLCPSST